MKRSLKQAIVVICSVVILIFLYFDIIFLGVLFQQNPSYSPDAFSTPSIEYEKANKEFRQRIIYLGIFIAASVIAILILVTVIFKILEN